MVSQNINSYSELTKNKKNANTDARKLININCTSGRIAPMSRYRTAELFTGSKVHFLLFPFIKALFIPHVLPDRVCI